MKDGLYINRGRTKDHKYLIEVTSWKKGKTDAPDKFYQAGIPPIEGHFLIEHNSPYGGGMGGWEEVNTFVGIAHSRKEIPEKVHGCALEYALKMSKKLRLPVTDQIRRREGKLVDLTRK